MIPDMATTTHHRRLASVMAGVIGPQATVEPLR